MRFRSIKGKRATVQLYMNFFELILAAIILVTFFLFVKGIRENTTLEKNYLARDIALTIDAVYAAPGEISAAYPTDELKDDANMNKYIVELKDNLVRVREPAEQISKIYWFADNSQTVIDESFRLKSQLVITKQDNAIDIRAR